MGLFKIFISVESFGEDFIDLFNTTMYDEDYAQRLSELRRDFEANSTPLSFWKLCAMQLAKQFDEYLSIKRVDNPQLEFNPAKNAFIRSDYEIKLEDYLLSIDKLKGSSILKMMRLKKDSVNDHIGIVLCVKALLMFDDLHKKSKDYISKQADLLNKQMIQILKETYENNKNKPVKKQVDISENNTIEEQFFYFESKEEYILYIGKLSRTNNAVVPVKWINNSLYMSSYKQGYAEVEQRNYRSAESHLIKCLDLNPVAINARFELAELYLQKKNLKKAKEMLRSVSEYLFDNTLVARYYRRNGYIAIEEKNYELAAACYKYSLDFENHPTVSQEIAYIAKKGYHVSGSTDYKQIIGKNGIRVFEKEDMNTIKKITIGTSIERETAVKYYELVAGIKPKTEPVPVIKEETVIDDRKDEKTVESTKCDTITAQDDTMYCRFCGKKIPSVAAYCNYCGKKL